MSNDSWIEELLLSQKEEGRLSEKQVKILEAAIEIFTEKGYSATSTHEIAKRAGVAEGTIFRHYKTKKDLLLSIVSPTLTKIVAPFFAKEFIKQVFNGTYSTYEQFLRALIQNRFEFARKFSPALRIFIQEMALHPELKEQYQSIFADLVMDKFIEIIKHFQSKGELIAFPPETIVRMTVSTIAGFLITRFLILPERDWNDELEIEHTIQFLMHGLQNRP